MVRRSTWDLAPRKSKAKSSRDCVALKGRLPAENGSWKPSGARKVLSPAQPEKLALQENRLRRLDIILNVLLLMLVLMPVLVLMLMLLVLVVLVLVLMLLLVLNAGAEERMLQRGRRFFLLEARGGEGRGEVFESGGDDV